MSETASTEPETKNGASEEDTKHSGNGAGDEQTNTSTSPASEPKKNGEQPKKSGEQPSKKHGDSNGDGAKKNVTKIPVTGGETEDSKQSGQKTQEGHSIPVTIRDGGSTPVTIHHSEEKKGQKQPRQPSKKEQAESIKQQANKEFAVKRYAAAIQLYNEALNLDPNNHLLYSNRAAARYNLAQEIANQSEHPDAKDHCAIHSEVSPSWNASMSLYYGGLEDALKAIEIEPNFLKAYLRVGACLVALGKYQAAVQTYEATLTRFPTDESVQSALKDAKAKAAKLEEGFPLFHSFINLAGQPQSAPPQAAPPSNVAASESAARLHRELFGKRNALVQTPKPETRWQFYFEQPPNPRSTASWEPDPRRRDADDEEEYQGEEGEQQYQRPSQPSSRFHRQSQYQPSPRFQRSSFQSPFQQQPRYHQQPYQQQQQPYQQQQQQQPYQPQQSYAQSPHYQQPPPMSQPQYQPNKKRSDHTSIPNRKATNGYLQELCEKLRVGQYFPALLEQGVETVDDLMLLTPEAIQSIFPTLGHQARVLDWLNKARGD